MATCEMEERSKDFPGNLSAFWADRNLEVLFPDWTLLNGYFSDYYQVIRRKKNIYTSLEILFMLIIKGTTKYEWQNLVYHVQTHSTNDHFQEIELVFASKMVDDCSR